MGLWGGENGNYWEIRKIGAWQGENGNSWEIREIGAWRGEKWEFLRDQRDGRVAR